MDHIMKKFSKINIKQPFSKMKQKLLKMKQNLLKIKQSFINTRHSFYEKKQLTNKKDNFTRYYYEPRYRSRRCRAYYLDQLCSLSTRGFLNSVFSLFVLMMLMEEIVHINYGVLDQVYDVWYAIVVASVAASVMRRNADPITPSVRAGFVVDFVSYFHLVIRSRTVPVRVFCYFLRVHRPLRFIWAKDRENMSSSIQVTVLKYVYYTFLLRIICAYSWILISSLDRNLEGESVEPRAQRRMLPAPRNLVPSDMESFFSTSQQFATALYFVNKIFIPIGPPVNPGSDFDRVLFLLVMMMGTLLVSGAAVAALSSVISVYMRADEEFWTRYRLIIRDLTKRSGIPESLRAKVETYYKMYWHKRRAVSTTELLPSFPPVLAKSVYTDIYFAAMQKSGLLRDLPYHFLSDLAQQMDTILYIPGEPIIKRNSQKNSLIFIAYGDIEMLTAEDDHSAMLRFTRGTVLSPWALTAEGAGRAHVCVRAATFCAAHRLPAVTVSRVGTTRASVADRSRAALEDHMNKVKMHYAIREHLPTQYKSSILEFKQKLLALNTSKVVNEEFLRVRRRYLLEIAGCYLMRNRADGSMTDDSDAICLRPTFPCILQPRSSLLTAWNWLVATLIIAVCFTYPYYLVYKSAVPLDFWFFDMLVTVVFVLDIIAYLSTGVNVEDGVPITFLQTSLQQAWSLKFVIDVIATINMGLFKIGRFHKAISVIRSLEEEWVYHSNVIRFIRYSLILILFCYFLAAFQHKFLCSGYDYCVVTNFTHPPFWSKNPPHDDTIADRLCFSLYWAISVLTFTAHLEFNQTGVLMGLVATTILEACIMLHLFIEAVYSATIMVTTAFRGKYDSCIEEVRHFLIRHKVTEELRERFLEHLQLCWTTKKAYSMASHQNTVFYDLPAHVYHDILTRQRSKYILTIPFMKLLHKDDLTRISSNAVMFDTAPNEILINTGDIITEMYVIKQGFCEVLNPDTREVVATLVAKNHFGVLECLFRFPAYYTVRAATHVRLFSISRKHVEQSLDIPQIKDAIQFVKEQEEYSRLQIKREPFVTYQPPASAPTKEWFPLPRKHEKDAAFSMPFTKLGFFSILRHMLPRFTFRPDSELLARLEIYRAFCAIACAFVFPSFTYLVLQFPWLNHVALVLDLSAYADILLRSLVAYFDANGILIYHPANTVAHYLRGAFCMDFISCMPLENLENSWKYTNYDGTMYQATVMKQVLMMNRLLQLYRLPGTLEVLTSRIQRRDIILVLQALPLFLTMLNVLTSLLVFSSVKVYYCDDNDHWAFEPMKDKGGSWIYLFQDAYRFNVTAAPWNMHLGCYFWIVYEAATIGYNTISPSNLSIMAVLFGAMVFGYLMVIYISVRIISIRANVNSTLATYQEHMKDLKQFMQRENLDQKLQMELIDYYKLNWKKTGGVDANDVLKLCDQMTLRTDAILHLYGPAFAKCPILADCDASILRVLGRAVGVVHFLRGTTIFQEDDIIDHLYLVYSGMLHVRTTDWVQGISRVTKLAIGSMVGNLNDTPGSRVKYGLAAATEVHLLHMRSVAFHQIVGYCDDRAVYKLMEKYRVNDEPYIRAEDVRSWLPKSVQLSRQEIKMQSCLVQVFLIMVSLLSVYTVVYNAGFQDHSPSVLALLYVLDTFFLVKFVLHVLKPELVKLTLVTEEVDVVRTKKYFKSAEFMFDVASCIPIELLALLGHDPWLLASWLRLNRLLRVKTVIKFLKRYEKRATEYLVLSTLALVMWFTLYVHCCACGWFFVGWTVNRDRPGTSWFYDDDGRGICGSEYFCSIYFILTSFTANGVSDVMPKHQIEVAYASLFVISSTMVYVVYVGEFSNIVHYASFRAFSYYSKVLELQKFLKTNRVSPVLVNLVKKYSVLLWRETRGEQLPAFLVKAPLCLKLKVMSHAYMAEAALHPVFKHCERALLRQVIGHLRQYYYDENMYVARQDEITNSMYFVHTGEVQEIRDLDAESKRPAGFKPILHNAGKHFGAEQGLIHNRPFRYSYRTTIKSQILMLCLDDWEYLLNHFPVSKRVIDSYQWTFRDGHDDYDDQAAETKKSPPTGRQDTIVNLGDPDNTQKNILEPLHPRESTVHSEQEAQDMRREDNLVSTLKIAHFDDASKETVSVKTVVWAPKEKEIFDMSSEYSVESIFQDDSTHLFQLIHNAAKEVDTVTDDDDNVATLDSSPVSVPYQSVEEYIAYKYKMGHSYSVNSSENINQNQDDPDGSESSQVSLKYLNAVVDHSVQEYIHTQLAETMGDGGQQASRVNLHPSGSLSSPNLPSTSSFNDLGSRPNSELQLFKNTSSFAVRRDSLPSEQDEPQLPSSSKQLSQLNKSSDDKTGYGIQRNEDTLGVPVSKTKVVDFDSDAAALMNNLPKSTDILGQQPTSSKSIGKLKIVESKQLSQNQNSTVTSDEKITGISDKPVKSGIVIKDFDSDVAAQMTVTDSTSLAPIKLDSPSGTKPPSRVGTVEKFEMVEQIPKEDDADLVVLPIEPKEMPRKVRRSSKQTVEQSSETEPTNTQRPDESKSQTKQTANDPPLALPSEQDEPQLPSSKELSQLNERSDDKIGYDIQRSVDALGIPISKPKLVDFDSDVAAQMTVADSAPLTPVELNSPSGTEPPTRVGTVEKFEMVEQIPKEDAADLVALPIEPKEMPRKVRRSSKQTVEQSSETEPTNTQRPDESKSQTKQTANDPPGALPSEQDEPQLPSSKELSQLNERSDDKIEYDIQRSVDALGIPISKPKVVDFDSHVAAQMTVADSAPLTPVELNSPSGTEPPTRVGTVEKFEMVELIPKEDAANLVALPIEPKEMRRKAKRSSKETVEQSSETEPTNMQRPDESESQTKQTANDPAEASTSSDGGNSDQTQSDHDNSNRDKNSGEKKRKEKQD